MIRLTKYLKQFTGGLILIIFCLFFQAMCELVMPTYMSDMVNVVILQGGIDHTAPMALEPSDMDLILSFLTPSQQRLFDEGYTLAEPTKEIKKVFPNAKDPTHIKNQADKKALTQLDDAFNTAAFAIMEHLGNGIDSFETGNISNLYSITSPTLTQLEESYKKSLTDAQTQKQSGLALSKFLYQKADVDISKMQSGHMFRVGGIMLLIALLAGTASIMVSFISSKVATGAARQLRLHIFKKVQSFSNAEFDKFSTASLITRCTNDITQIQSLFMIGVRMIFFAPVMGLGGIIMALRTSVSMSWIAAVAVLVLLGMVATIMSIAMPRFKLIQKLVDKLNLICRENLSGIMVIRAFATQDHEKERFEKANKDLTDVNLFVNRIMSLMMPSMTFIMNGVTLLVIWVGAKHIANSSMQIGDMIAYMQYAMHIVMSFLFVSMVFFIAPRAEVSAVRIFEVLDTDLEIKDPVKGKKFNPSKKGIVEFKDVTFRYPGAQMDTLSNISFTAAPGKTTAIIGATGSGKTTIANLLMRFNDVSDGQVLVEGVDVREALQEQLRDKIGYVPQRAILLSGTIESNLRYGKQQASIHDIEKAIETAQAKDFISKREGGIESEISQGGTNVSGGQRQRLSIARALVKKPNILLFDDCFSALDFKTDAALRRSLSNYAKNSTILIVAQRVGTIINADQIIVLDEGKIVGIGTHNTLLKECPEYYEIASSQLSKEELA